MIWIEGVNDLARRRWKSNCGYNSARQLAEREGSVVCWKRASGIERRYCQARLSSTARLSRLCVDWVPNQRWRWQRHCKHRSLRLDIVITHLPRSLLQLEQVDRVTLGCCVKVAGTTSPGIGCLVEESMKTLQSR